MKTVVALVDCIAESEAWTVENDSHLARVRSQISLDDELENSAIELAEYFKHALQGLPFRKMEGLASNLSPDDLRRELRTIAGDLRLAVGE